MCLRAYKFLVCWCRQVFLTVVDCKIMTSNSSIYASGNLQQEGVMAERKRRSKERWQQHYCSCNVCKIIISSKGGNTSMLQHTWAWIPGMPSILHSTSTSVAASQPIGTSVTESKYPVVVTLALKNKQSIVAKKGEDHLGCTRASYRHGIKTGNMGNS